MYTPIHNVCAYRCYGNHPGRYGAHMRNLPLFYGFWATYQLCGGESTVQRMSSGWLPRY